MEKGALTWLSALPLKPRNFHLNKLAFKDAVHLRFGWTIPDTHQPISVVVVSL